MKKNQPALRLVVGKQRDLCSSNNLTAPSPLGSAVRSCSMSLIVEGAKPTSWPISARFKPVLRSSVMRDDHVSMGPSLRHAVDLSQRQSVTALRNTVDMPRPPGMPPLDSIGARVKWWRIYRKIKRKDLARTVGIGYSTLADLENNEQDSSKSMHLIAAALRLNPYYLDTGKGEPEAEFAQEAPKDSSPWPISIPRSEIEKLNMIERSYLESRMIDALQEIKSERKKSITR